MSYVPAEFFSRVRARTSDMIPSAVLPVYYGIILQQTVICTDHACTEVQGPFKSSFNIQTFLIYRSRVVHILHQLLLLFLFSHQGPFLTTE